MPFLPLPFEEKIEYNQFILTFRSFVCVFCLTANCFLIKIPLAENLAGLDAVLKSYNGGVANSDDKNLIVMACDDSIRIDNFIKTMRKYNPIDVVRGGSVVIEVRE